MTAVRFMVEVQFRRLDVEDNPRAIPNWYGHAGPFLDGAEAVEAAQEAPEKTHPWRIARYRVLRQTALHRRPNGAYWWTRGTPIWTGEFPEAEAYGQSFKVPTRNPSTDPMMNPTRIVIESP